MRTENVKERGNRLLRWLDRYCGIPVVAVLGMLHRKRHLPDKVKCVGIFLFGAIGDSILAFPTILDLQKKYEHIEITIFVTKDNAVVFPLFAYKGNIKILSLTKPIRAIKSIREYSFDLLIDYNQWIRASAVFTFFAKTRFSIGFRTDNQFRHYVYDSFVEHSSRVHEIDNYRNLIIAVDVVAPNGFPMVTIKDEALKKIADLNLQHYVVFHPWASGYRRELKQWPIDRWVMLADYLIKKGHTIVVTGGQRDREASFDLISKMQCYTNKIVSCAGDFSLMETAALLSKADFMVTINTGIMHLGAALDVPMIALHGPTNPNRWGPVSEKSVVVSPDGVPCGYLNLGFEYIDSDVAQKCMYYISVEKVINSAKKILSDGAVLPVSIPFIA